LCVFGFHYPITVLFLRGISFFLDGDPVCAIRKPRSVWRAIKRMPVIGSISIKYERGRLFI